MSAEQIIGRSRRVAVLCHSEPDGDAIGSGLALTAGLEWLGKVCVLISPDPIPNQFSHLPGISSVLVGSLPTPGPDLIIAVDTSGLDRLGSLYTSNVDAFSIAPIINIDHHLTNDRYGTVDILDPQAASVAELVYDLLVRLGVLISVDIATCLLFAIVSDSRSFRTGSTTPRTLRVAAQLQEAGAPLEEIIRLSEGVRPAAHAMFWGRLLDNLHSDGDLYWISTSDRAMTEQEGAREAWNGLVDLLFSLDGAAVVAVFRETETGEVKVSLRSSGQVNVAATASAFSGGGHVRASGFCVPGTLAEVEPRVIDYLRQQIRDGREPDGGRDSEHK